MTIEGKPNEKMTVSLSLRLTSSPRYAVGELNFKYEPWEALDGDQLIGWMAPCVGGGVEFHDARTGDTWFASVPALWDAFVEGQKKQEHSGMTISREVTNED